MKPSPDPTALHHVILRHLFRLIGGSAISLLGGFLLHAATLPAGFTEVQVAEGLASATAMAFSPDGRLFVCEQAGALRVISNGTLLPAPFTTVNTVQSGERGLLGVTFDPDFGTNRFVYVYYTVPGTPAHNRVSRFTASIANPDLAEAGSEMAILELDNLSGATIHNGGAIHFGLDGKLYVAVGENDNPSNAQSLSNRLGKMLRVNADGTIPGDNPTSFPGITGSTTGGNRAIWAVGFRNPFTFAFQPGTGRLFINDVGQHAVEEINDGISGSNYGWSICEGPCSPPNADMTDPFFQYGHGGTGGCGIVGGAFYNPSFKQFPASFVGKYFFGDVCEGWIRLLDPSNSTASDFATGISVLVDLKVGPEGSLYYLARTGGQVWRVSIALTGRPTPTATATPPATPTPTPIPAQPQNIATRLRVETGNNVMIAGFIITGNASRSVLFRGIGPSLIASGLGDVLLDPVLELRGSNGALILQNNDWKDTQRALIEGTIYEPTDDRESVIIASLQPGAHTAILTGNEQTTGVGLVEVYDNDQGIDVQLANISTRGFVQTGDNVMIGGFILGGSTSNTRVAIRGIGPSLVQSGISNVLADPTLELHDSNGTTLTANDDWRDDPLSSSQLTFHNLALQDSRESGIFTSLAPGAYTAILAGNNGGTGIGLIEIYNIP